MAERPQGGGRVVRSKARLAAAACGTMDRHDEIMRRVNVSLDASLWEFVSRVARALHLSKSAAVRSMLAEMALAETGEPASAQAPGDTEA